MNTRPRRHKRRPAPLCLPTDVAQAVRQLAADTGWTENKALAFIASAGWNALNSAADKLPALRQVMTAAIAHHETEIAMRKRLATTAEKLRAARKALAHKTGGAE